MTRRRPIRYRDPANLARERREREQAAAWAEQEAERERTVGIASNDGAARYLAAVGRRRAADAARTQAPPAPNDRCGCGGFLATIRPRPPARQFRVCLACRTRRCA